MLQPKLYLCPTPIGNMEDMTLRALRVLRECHRIYCEDTRNTGAMLSRLGISKPLISCHEHNEEGRAEEIAGRVAEGEAIAFVSDAGCPAYPTPGSGWWPPSYKGGCPLRCCRALRVPYCAGS